MIALAGIFPAVARAAARHVALAQRCGARPTNLDAASDN
jgi:hypothetical protein